MTLCAVGTYSEGAQDKCTPCPAGYSCPSKTDNFKVLCYPGTYTIGSSSVSQNVSIFQPEKFSKVLLTAETQSHTHMLYNKSISTKHCSHIYFCWGRKTRKPYEMERTTYTKSTHMLIYVWDS